ncbi:hypothetical protein LCGC14_1599150 [marine sediment metagenome]|uniref:Uncharacterized protein n=1 Tax=marine sediment metagenome TaxID=412755 RepID=A0A0F9IBP4_9ZZZZ
MNIFEMIIVGIIGLFLLYGLIRVLSSGIFRSYFETKNQFEKGERNGKKRQKEK